jgi:hypothetical protein
MNGKTWHGYALTGLFALVALDKYTLEVRNLGPGDNWLTLNVQVAKKERNP